MNINKNIDYLKKKEIYEKAKDSILEYRMNFVFSLKAVIELECDKYEMGVISFYYSLCGDDDKIDSMINCLSKEYENTISTDILTSEYTGILIEIGLSIVDKHPFKALHVHSLIYNTYDIVGNLPSEILDLGVEIVSSVANNDIKKAFELIDIIEVDHYQLEALQKIRNRTIDDTFIFKKVTDAISNLKKSIEIE